MLTIAYLTNRRNSRIEWFFDSLANQAENFWDDLRLVIVDFFLTPLPPHRVKCPIVHVMPKPTPWQGEYRVTDRDYFAAANARNTALCLAEDGAIAFVDDLSVLSPSWLYRARVAYNERNIYLGSFDKARDLIVRNGIVDESVVRLNCDTRHGSLAGPVPCGGQWLYGCSFVAPVEHLLAVNGFDEACDGLAFEDVCLGLRLEKAGRWMYYDLQMFTMESEELHQEAFSRANRPIQGYRDCAFEMLHYVKYNQQSRGTPNLRAIRQEVLSGKPFPMHSGLFVWPDGKTLLG